MSDHSKKKSFCFDTGLVDVWLNIGLNYMKINTIKWDYYDGAVIWVTISGERVTSAVPFHGTRNHNMMFLWRSISMYVPSHLENWFVGQSISSAPQCFIYNDVLAYLSYLSYSYIALGYVVIPIKFQLIVQTYIIHTHKINNSIKNNVYHVWASLKWSFHWI